MVRLRWRQHRDSGLLIWGFVGDVLPLEGGRALGGLLAWWSDYCGVSMGVSSSGSFNVEAVGICNGGRMGRCCYMGF